jgi:MFS-type transporter involved in bile tolerance (Atg22 family)
MSNIFISSSFIYLASIEAGCIDADGKVLDECNVKVRGQTPASLVANIAVISGLLSAFFMPIIGAMVDYTPYRKQLGQATAFIITVIQTVQIGTVQATWFPMSILQALAGFFYQVEILATYAYLPDISGTVGQAVMTKCTSNRSCYVIAVR